MWLWINHGNISITEYNCSTLTNILKNTFSKVQKEAADKDGHPGMPQSETSILNLRFNLKGLFICRQQMSATFKGVEKSVIKSSFSWLIHWMELSSDRNMLSINKCICSPQILPQLSLGVNLPGCIATTLTLNFGIKTRLNARFWAQTHNEPDWFHLLLSSDAQAAWHTWQDEEDARDEGQDGSLRPDVSDVTDDEGGEDEEQWDHWERRGGPDHLCGRDRATLVKY